MGSEKKKILCVNGGSSSIKFAVFEADGDDLVPSLRGQITRIGLGATKLTFREPGGNKEGDVAVKGSGMEDAANFLLDWLGERMSGQVFSAIGHRVVHGGRRREPAVIDDELLAELGRISGYDPDHLPGEIALIRLWRQRDPGMKQLACFDTSFHSTMPRAARMIPLPRRYAAAGLERYGFHGLSYAYIVEELFRIGGPALAEGRVIIAHLGSGASLAAVKGGESVDTTMGFTPTGGIMMGTRSGDLDPGAIWWILQQEGLGAAQLSDLVNHQSGLLGVSGISSDMQDLLSREGKDEPAAEAVEMFTYQVKKSIGAYAAVLGGLDTLVFTGGIGERSAVIRSRVCSAMEWLGVAMDQRANEQNALLISRKESPIHVYAIPTDEEKMIGRQILKQFNL